MTSRQEEYRRVAEEMEKLAVQAEDEASKKMFREIAEHWRELEQFAKSYNE